MKTRALLLLFMLTAAAERNLEKRIYGGHDCLPGERQYNVKIWQLNQAPPPPRVTKCGGSLINRRWVLTAGHCGNGRPLNLQLGAHGLRPLPQDQVIPANQQFVYHGHDIMLLRLTTDVPNLPIIHLPHTGCGRPAIGVDIGVAGFGPTGAVWVPGTNFYISDNGPNPANLQCGTMTITPCLTVVVPNQGTITPTNSFCYDHLPPVPAPRPPNGVDTTCGDSGGAVEWNGRIHGVHIISGPLLCVLPAKALDVCNPGIRDWIHAVLTQQLYDPLHNVPVGDPNY